MEAKVLQKSGGACAILEALIYISAFVVYGGVLVYPEANASPSELLSFLSDHYLILSLLNLTSYVLFGIVLVVLVMALHNRSKKNAPILSQAAYIFGLIWAGLVIASGMIGNIGLNSVIDMGASNPENAMLLYSSINVVTEGLGGGNEIIGGIWVLLISIVGLRSKNLSKPLNFLGMLVGIAGILTVYPLDLFTEIFGLGQIIWFIWIGSLMIRTQTSL
jgi:hypothetical protein